MRRETWRETTRRLDRDARTLSWPERLVQAAGLLVGFLGLNALMWTRDLFPSRGWWATALAAWVLVFCVGYAYLVVRLIARSRSRRRRRP